MLISYIKKYNDTGFGTCDAKKTCISIFKIMNPTSNSYKHAADHPKASISLHDETPGFRRSIQALSGHQYLIIGSAIISILSGLLLTVISLLGLIQPLFVSGMCSMLGCASIMLGSFVLYDQYRNRMETGRIVHDAINRVLKDYN